MSKTAIYNKAVDIIRNKAVDIIRTRKFEQQHFIECLKAGICPSCGEPLRTTGLTGEDHLLCVCKKGCPLISPEDVDYGSLKHNVWKNCIDNTIRKAARGCCWYCKQTLLEN